MGLGALTMRLVCVFRAALPVLSGTPRRSPSLIRRQRPTRLARDRRRGIRRHDRRGPRGPSHGRGLLEVDPLSGRQVDESSRRHQPCDPGFAGWCEAAGVRDPGREPIAQGAGDQSAVKRLRRRGRWRAPAARGRTCRRRSRSDGGCPRGVPGPADLPVDLRQRPNISHRRSQGRPRWRWSRSRADARPRQDADGGLPRRHTRHADPCRRTRAVGDGVAHHGDPRPRGADRRRRGDPVARSRRPVGTARGGHLHRRDRWLDAGRRGAAAVAGPGQPTRPTGMLTTRTTTHDHAAVDHDHQTTTTMPSTAHSHGGVEHSHLPAAGTTISWRSLFVLGLAGGLIPSTSALLILLGSIAAGRPAFGLILVVAFGIGMALVMAGVGLALVLARGRLDGIDAGVTARSRERVRAARRGGPGLRSWAVPHGPGRRRRDASVGGA